MGKEKEIRIILYKSVYEERMRCAKKRMDGPTHERPRDEKWACMRSRRVEGNEIMKFQGLCQSRPVVSSAG